MKKSAKRTRYFAILFASITLLSAFYCKPALGSTMGVPRSPVDNQHYLNLIQQPDRSYSASEHTANGLMNSLGSNFRESDINAGIDAVNPDAITRTGNTIRISGTDNVQAGQNIQNFIFAADRARTGQTPTSMDAVRNNAYTENQAKMKDEPNKIFNFIIWLFCYTIYLATSVMGFIIYYAGTMIDFFFSANKLAGSSMVQSGWLFTRDTLNFVFILVLLAISFSTIAGIETFQMRKALPSLIFAALLVNFSLAIAGAFLQISNVMTTSVATSILSGSKNTEVAKLAEGKKVGSALVIGLMNSSSIGQFYTYSDKDWEKGSKTIPKNGGPDPSAWATQKTTPTDEYFSMAINSALALVMIVIFTIVFVALAALMAIRIVMLVILLILSPVPFVFSIIPQAKSYADKWWSNFINYTIFLPVATFFLALSIRLMDTKDPGGKSSLVSQFFSDEKTLTGTFVGPLGSILDMVFISIFVFASLMVAKSLGIAGASAVTSAAKKTGMVATKIGVGMPAHAIGKGIKETANIAGNLAAKTPLVGSALRGARTTGRVAQRLYKGQESREQLAEKEKALAGMSKDEKYAAWKRGNVAAGVSLMKGDDLEKEDYSKLNAQVPKSTEAHDNVQNAWKRKDPISAIMSDDLRSRVSSGDAQHYSKADQDSVNELQTAFKKMKPEDYAKLDGNDLRTAIKAGVKVPLTKSQLDATMGSTNADLQLAASEHLDALEKAPAGTMNPGQAATLNYARNKLKMDNKTNPPPPRPTETEQERATRVFNNA